MVPLDRIQESIAITTSTTDGHLQNYCSFTVKSHFAKVQSKRKCIMNKADNYMNYGCYAHFTFRLRILPIHNNLPIFATVHQASTRRESPGICMGQTYVQTDRNPQQFF